MRTMLLVSLVKGMTYGIVFVAGLVWLNATTELKAGGDTTGRTECFNKHTAQITEVPTGQACPVPINPYR